MASNETIYGNMTSSVTSVETGTSEGGPSSDSHAVMNEKVQAIAGSVYEEFERMISKYDQDVVKNLMPVMVNVLESLDFAYTETQELEVECELLKEDNEQLVTQYEREKQLRKSSEQKALEIEDSYEGERKETGVKIESLTSIVKMFELKTKNFQDQSKWNFCSWNYMGIFCKLRFHIKIYAYKIDTLHFSDAIILMMLRSTL